MRIISFGSVNIPQGDGRQNSPIPFRSSLVPLRGGAYDQDGLNTYPESKIFAYSCWVQRDDTGSGDGIDTVIDKLLAQGAQGARYLIAEMRDGSQRLARAKLVQATPAEDATDWLPDSNTATGYARLQLQFELAYPYWQDIGDNVWFLDDGEVLDSGLTLGGANATDITIDATTETFTIDNTGSAPIYAGNVIIEADAASSITDIRIDNLSTEEYVEWDGTLAAGERLTLSLDTLGIAYEGSDAWVDTTIPATQTRFWFLRIGANNFQITVSSLTGTGTFTYYWANQYLR